MLIAHPRLLGALRMCSKKCSCGNLMKWGTAMNKSKHGTSIYNQVRKHGSATGKRKGKYLMLPSICNSSATHCNSNNLDRNSLKMKKASIESKKIKDKKRGLKKNDIFWARENQSHLRTASPLQCLQEETENQCPWGKKTRIEKRKGGKKNKNKDSRILL